ncbi:copper homeostasis protein CutC [Bifidobacterium sp.]|uniref:copper homeostasis protein CutC n=1 Tax=Bifidobacterium sp. TaxID=41200 RepID=UPI0039ED43B9
MAMSESATARYEHILQIAVTSSHGAAIALANGADEIELCSALELGGLTPSDGLLRRCVALGVPVHALIRSRPGDFLYSQDEMDTMGEEIRSVLRSGASGIVIGALDEHRHLDIESLRTLIAVAHECKPDVTVTVNRAIDRSENPAAEVRRLASSGLDINRILTSGGGASAADGITTIASMARSLSGSTMTILCGGGVQVKDIASIMEAGACSIHLSAKRGIRQSSQHGATYVSLGYGDKPTAIDHFSTDGGIVHDARVSLDSYLHSQNA